MRTSKVVMTAIVAAMVLLVSGAAEAQNKNPRFGKWKLKSDAPPPALNIMTYEPHGEKGMRITVESTNSKGEKNKWSYVTEFDGEFRPVEGQEDAETSVRMISDRTAEIVNKRNGRVTQILTNVLSPDHNTLGIIYMRQDENGKTTRVSFATYERIE